MECHQTIFTGSFLSAAAVEAAGFSLLAGEAAEPLLPGSVTPPQAAVAINVPAARTAVRPFRIVGFMFGFPLP
ncbi:hypothetical protein D3C76_1774320 [compost metagenome]